MGWLRASRAPQQPWPAWGRLLARLVIGAGAAALIVWLAGFPEEPAAWAVVAVAVVVGDTTGQTINASWNRVEGSVVGCLSGAVVAVGLPMLALPLRVMIAMGLALLSCRILGVGAGWRLGTALAGFFVFVPGAQEWQMVGWRLGATLLGIGVGVSAVLLIAPDSAASRLARGLRDALMGVADGVDAALRRWEGDASVPPPVAPRAAALRPLVADRRVEVIAHGPDVAGLTAMLDGLEVAAAGIARLARHGSAGGGVGLDVVIRPQVEDVAARIRAACEATCDALAGHPGASAQVRAACDALEGVDADLTGAVEHLRAAGVTPGADARELTRLFGVINALGVVADGVRSAARAMADAGR
jgi:hypothetical protein